MQVEKCQRNLDAFYSLTSSPEAEVLSEVLERTADGCRDELALVFTSKVLVFEANADDDSLSVSSKDVAEFAERGTFQDSRSLIWQRFIGKPFGWGWATVNQQGYCDGGLLSFESAMPAVSLEVMASSIEIALVFPEDELGRQSSGYWSVGLVENGELAPRHPQREITTAPSGPTNRLKLEEALASACFAERD